MKKYWLLLNTNVHCVVKKWNVLLFHIKNPENSLEFFHNKPIAEFCRKIIANNYVIEISATQLENNKINSFIMELQKKELGKILEKSETNKKPFQFYPKLKIYNEQRINYLRNITFYLNTENEYIPVQFGKAYKQFLFPILNTTNREFYFEILKNFIENNNNGFIRNLTFIGGNILKYSKFNDLITLINISKITTTLNFHVFDIVNDFIPDRYSVSPNVKTNIFITFPIEKQTIEACLSKLPIIQHKSFTFIVESVSDFEQSQEIIEEFHIEKASFQPHYNFKNYDFFEDEVFTDKESILNGNITQKTIFRNSVVNTEEYGRLIVFPDEKIYSNANKKSLGKISENKISEIIKKEMENKLIWKKTRNNVLPCKNCVYQFLCPPISNYEYVMKKHNLCSVWQKSE